MTTNVKLLNINSIGPVLAVLQSETSDSIFVTNPAQLGTDEEGNVIIADYLESIADADEITIFMKYNVISVSTPAPSLASAYISAVDSITEKDAGLILPSTKIVV